MGSLFYWPPNDKIKGTILPKKKVQISIQFLKTTTIFYIKKNDISFAMSPKVGHRLFL